MRPIQFGSPALDLLSFIRSCPSGRKSISNFTLMSRFTTKASGREKEFHALLPGLVDFGGSDGPATDQQLEHARVKVLHIPVTIGAVVPAYNLPGVNEDLRFTGAALAGIFMGKIKRWNDPILVRANPSVRLPDKDIYVVSRLDSSGTTYIWTDYLSKVSPEWNKQLGRGTQVLFPVGNGTAVQ